MDVTGSEGRSELLPRAGTASRRGCFSASEGQLGGPTAVQRTTSESRHGEDDGMKTHLVDFLPFEVAEYLESKAFAATSMLVVGPAGSGKSPLLTALANATGDHLQLAGLSDLRATLPCLYDHDRAFSLHVPRYLEAPDSDLAHLLARQAVQVAIADDPSDETWSVLSDLIHAGISIWASTTAVPPDSGRPGAATRPQLRPGRLHPR